MLVVLAGRSPKQWTVVQSTTQSRQKVGDDVDKKIEMNENESKENKGSTTRSAGVVLSYLGALL